MSAPQQPSSPDGTEHLIATVRTGGAFQKRRISHGRCCLFSPRSHLLPVFNTNEPPAMAPLPSVSGGRASRCQLPKPMEAIRKGALALGPTLMKRHEFQKLKLANTWHIRTSESAQDPSNGNSLFGHLYNIIEQSWRYPFPGSRQLHPEVCALYKCTPVHTRIHRLECSQ